MRISDWSSDVCSSDLARQARPHPVRTRRRSRPRGRAGVRARGDEAADQDEGRRPPRRHLAPGGLRAMSKTEDFKAKTDDQLAEQLGELKREAFNLRFQAATGQLEKASRVQDVRRSEERRVGKECTSTCRARGSQCL